MKRYRCDEIDEIDGLDAPASTALSHPSHHEINGINNIASLPVQPPVPAGACLTMNWFYYDHHGKLATDEDPEDQNHDDGRFTGRTNGTKDSFSSCAAGRAWQQFSCILGMNQTDTTARSERSRHNRRSRRTVRMQTVPAVSPSERINTLIRCSYLMAKNSSLINETTTAAINPSNTTNAVMATNSGHSTEQKTDKASNWSDEQHNDIPPFVAANNVRQTAKVNDRLQFGIILEDANFIIDQLKNELIAESGVATSISVHPVIIHWSSCRSEGGYCGSQQETCASGIVYPCSRAQTELQWLLTHTPTADEERNDSDGEGDEGDDPNDERHRAREERWYAKRDTLQPETHISSTCGIPFYHIGNGQYPDGKRHRFIERHHEDPDDASHGERDDYNDIAIITTNAVIVTMKSMSQLLEGYLPAHMKLLTSFIANYVAPIEKWKVGDFPPLTSFQMYQRQQLRIKMAQRYPGMYGRDRPTPTLEEQKQDDDAICTEWELLSVEKRKPYEDLAQKANARFDNEQSGDEEPD